MAHIHRLNHTSPPFPSPCPPRLDDAQFILEEKFLGQFRIQPLLAVGIEGAWGLALCALVLPLASSMHVGAGGGGGAGVKSGGGGRGV